MGVGLGQPGEASGIGGALQTAISNVIGYIGRGRVNGINETDTLLAIRPDANLPNRWIGSAPSIRRPPTARR